ncbi:MAG: hypothetical protein ACO1PB_10725 [Ramlibacter sp.]
MKRCIAAVLLVLSAIGAARAQDVDAERRRIRDDRAQVDAAFDAAQQACYRRFAVNDCLDAARRQRNAAVADLRRQEVLLNDTERKRRAAQRLREIDERKAEQPTGRAARAEQARPVPAEESAPRGKPRAQAAFEGPKPGAGEAARTRQAFEARRRQAEAHKAQVLERNAQRGKPPAPDLPAPP